MDTSSTKGLILDSALDLFSVNGYEATSISQIADAVGIRKASLYSHFENKQAILEQLVETLTEQYERHSLFANADWTDPEFTKDKTGMNEETVIGMVQAQMRFVLHDPDISRVRKMLVIEQFRNPDLSRIQNKQSYADILKYNIGMIRYLIAIGQLRDEDAEIMAAQFCWPISMWIAMCDREPEREPEATELAARHIRQFFRSYRK